MKIKDLKEGVKVSYVTRLGIRDATVKKVLHVKEYETRHEKILIQEADIDLELELTDSDKDDAIGILASHTFVHYDKGKSIHTWHFKDEG